MLLHHVGYDTAIYNEPGSSTITHRFCEMPSSNIQQHVVRASLQCSSALLPYRINPDSPSYRLFGCLFVNPLQNSPFTRTDSQQPPGLQEQDPPLTRSRKTRCAGCEFLELAAGIHNSPSALQRRVPSAPTPFRPPMKVGVGLETFPPPFRFSPSSRTPGYQFSPDTGTVFPTTASKGDGINACSVQTHRIPNVLGFPCAPDIRKCFESGGILRPSPPPRVTRLATSRDTTSGSAPFSDFGILDGQPSWVTSGGASWCATEQTSVLQSWSWCATTSKILSRGGLPSPLGDVVGNCPRDNRNSVHGIQRHGRRLNCGVVDLYTHCHNSTEPYILLDTMG